MRKGKKNSMTVTNASFQNRTRTLQAIAGGVLLTLLLFNGCRNESVNTTREPELNQPAPVQILPQEAEMLEAAGKGNTARVRELLDSGVKANMRGPDRNTPLMEAAYGGHAETVKLLLERGADPSVKKRDGATAWTLTSNSQVLDVFKNVEALVTAAGEGNRTAVEDLMRKGTPVNALNRSGEAALHTASWHGKTEIVKLLLDNGANPELKKADGATPLSLASGQNHSQIVTLLNEALSKLPAATQTPTNSPTAASPSPK
ncbi:MAG: ankyrin repeat domain-containing protein [Pyrinomonadaceae bacterium]